MLLIPSVQDLENSVEEAESLLLWKVSTRSVLCMQTICHVLTRVRLSSQQLKGPLLSSFLARI